MKTISTTLILLLLTWATFAQNGINYKAVINDNNGNIIANTLIVVQFSILETTSSGTIVYQENHTPTTDANGLVILNIGEGTPVSGTFSTIDWGGDAHFLNVQVNSGPGLVDLGTSEFAAVPYAIHAESSSPHDHLGENWSGTESLTINTETNTAVLSLINTGNSGNGIDVTSVNRIGIAIGTAAIDGISINSVGDDGLQVSLANGDGVFVQLAGNYGGSFTGSVSGVFARSISDSNPDIILGGTDGGSSADDDGIIASDPEYASSDILIRSNDEVGVYLDVNNTNSGSFFVRNGTGTNVFRVNESGTIQQNGITIHASDRRLKKDIVDLSYGLDEVLQLEPKAYNWKDREQHHKTIGLIAQDVRTIIKEIVHEEDDMNQTLGISYMELIPVLINAIKEQQGVINSEKEKVTQLKIEVAKFKDLDKRLKAVENNLDIGKTTIKK